MRQKITLITLGVRDFQRSLLFYERCLGWKKSAASTDNMAVFPLGGVALGIYPQHLFAEDAIIKNRDLGFSGITLSHNTRSEKEVDDVLVEVERLGAVIVKPAQKVSWGAYSGYFKDIDGHLIEVTFNPFWELDTNDNIMLP
jgi:uncharacterized protein